MWCTELSAHVVRVPMCTHTQVPAGTTHILQARPSPAHTQMPHTQQTHTHKHTQTGMHTGAHSPWDSPGSLPSQGLYTGCLLCLEDTHRDTCLAQSLNSCLRCRLLEALLGHIAVDACVPQPGPTHYPLTQLPPPADMARAEGELPSLEHSSASPFPLLGPPTARLPLLTRWSRLPSVCLALC